MSTRAPATGRPTSASGRPSTGRPPRRMLELFAGTGHVAAAFRGEGWETVTVDLDPTHRPDVVADARALPLRRTAGSFDFVWASPPCTEFSTADPRQDHATKQPDMSLVFAAVEFIAAVRPRFWIIENVRGAIPFLGVPAQKIGPWCLWGYSPYIHPPYEAQTWTKTRFRSAVARAAVPRALAEAVARTVVACVEAEVGSILDLRPYRRHRHQAAGPAAARRSQMGLGL